MFSDSPEMKNPRSAEAADELISWLRAYAESHIDSAAIDERRGIPPQIVLDFGSRGLFGLRAPREFGGLELAQSDVARILQQLAAIDLTLATFVSSHAIGLRTIQTFGREELKRALLPDLASGRTLSAFCLTERVAGSNPRAIETRADSDGRGGWILHGDKYFVDSASWANVFTVFARTPEEGRASGISAFAVPRDAAGLTVGPELLTMGMRGMVQHDVSMKGVRVGAGALLGNTGDGLAISQDTLAFARLNLAAKSVGGMKRCLQLLHRFAARRRVATGILWENPVTLSRAGRLVSAAAAVEALVGRISEAIDAGRHVPMEAILACKVAASEYLWEAAEALVQTLGARGYDEANDAARILRDARSFLVSEGPTETLVMYLGSRALNAGSGIEQFVSGELNAPHLARRLRDAAQECRDGGPNTPLAEADAEYWAAWRAGQIAVAAILAAAAAAPADSSAHGPAEWALLELGERTSAVLGESGRSAEWGLTRGNDLVQRIAGFARSIGDVEQTSRAPGWEPDPLLRRDLIRPEDAAELLERWNDTRAEYPRNETIHGAVERQAAATPDRTAIVADNGGLTYAELDNRANRLAARLARHGARPGVRVGLCVGRSVDLPVAIVAILKTGAAYVPLDTAQPGRRLAAMLDEMHFPVIVADRELAALLPPNDAIVVSPEPDDAADREHFGAVRVTAEETAYVLYTSGSTGTPKGVEVSHRSVVNLLHSMRSRPGFSAEDVLVAVTNVAFDIAALELFLPLVTGGRLVVANARQSLDGVALGRLMEESGATVLQGTPATWQMLLASGWTGDRRLKALCGGETLPPELAIRIRAATGSLWNMYGPTETTIWSCIEEVAEVEVGRDQAVPIGRPIANTRVYILDDALHPVPPGVPAEIFIAGDGLARGYWNRDDLTAERFLADPFHPGARMYRTGDTGKFLPDGRIVHVGRRDRQVKIRGFRVELGEIEAAIRSHPVVRDSVVEARSYGVGDTRLTAAVILQPGGRPEAISKALRAHVLERVPPWMVPGSFAILERFPLTPNGKLDRAALADALATRDSIEAAGEPRDEPDDRGPVEREIAAVWAGLLRTAHVAGDDDFFALGGHSLLATQVVSRVRAAFGVEIPVEFIFEKPTLSALVDAVEKALAHGARPGEAAAPPGEQAEQVGRQEALELSSTQQRFWFLDWFQPGSPRYNVPVALSLRGRLDVEALRLAAQDLLGRHEVLRTRIETREGRPLQMIEAASEWNLPIVSLENIPEDAAEGQRRRLIQEEANRPFELGAGSLFRATLLRRSEEDHTLLLTMHHIITDGWSAEVLVRDLGALYAARRSGRASSLSPLKAQYADYAVWEKEWLQGPQYREHLAYWRDDLLHLPPLNLPSDRPRTSKPSHRGSQVFFEFSEALTASLDELARRNGATLFMVLMAGWQALLSRYSDQDDFGVGFPIANRTRAEFENVAGCFLNTLVLRADLSEDPTFTELLGRVRKRALRAYAHQAAPFDRLVQELAVRRDPARNPLFQAMINMHNAPPSGAVFPGIETVTIPVRTPTSKLDLTLILRVREGRLGGEWEYSTDLFDEETIRRMAAQFETLLESAAADPEQLVADLPLLSPDSWSEVLQLREKDEVRTP